MCSCSQFAIPQPAKQLIHTLQNHTTILAGWLEEHPTYPAIHLAVKEENYGWAIHKAAAWVEETLAPKFFFVSGQSPYTLFLLLEDGTGLALSFHTWGETATYITPAYKILFDHTGRLDNRLHVRSTTHRVDFRTLDRHTREFWLNLWKIASLNAKGTHAALSLYVARALEALLKFLATCTEVSVEEVALAEEPAEIVLLNNILATPQPTKTRALELARFMSTYAADMGRQHGWNYPEALEQAVKAAWEQAGWPVWR